MKSWNVLRVLQVFCPTSDQTYGQTCECIALSALNAKCTSHWSVVTYLFSIEGVGEFAAYSK